VKKELSEFQMAVQKRQRVRKLLVRFGFSKRPTLRESEAMDIDGKFEFKNVMPGSYTARVAVVVNEEGARPSLQVLRLTPSVEGWTTGKPPDWTQLGVQLVFATGEDLQRVSGITASVPPDLSGADGFSLVEQGRGIRNEERAG
jgi:hypothetical protein